jgi:outer membrane protein assembly factor BamB
MHHGDSWIAAFDKITGKLAWKTPRNYTTPREGDHGYATPLVMEFGGKEALLVWGAQHLTIHDAADGSELWTCGNFNPREQALWPSIATPVVVDQMAVIAFGRNDRGAPRMHGIRLDGRGDVTSTNHVWKRDDVGTFVPSPACYQGRIYLVRDRGQIACLDPATGKTIWSDAFPKARASFYASPLIAGGNLYAAREDGVVFVAKLSAEGFQLLSQNDMGEPIIGSPVPTEDRILLRGENHLFCVGKQ